MATSFSSLTSGKTGGFHEIGKRVVAEAEAALAETDIVVISDYRHGLLSRRGRGGTDAEAARSGQAGVCGFAGVAEREQSHALPWRVRDLPEPARGAGDRSGIQAGAECGGLRGAESGIGYGADCDQAGRRGRAVSGWGAGDACAGKQGDGGGYDRSGRRVSVGVLPGGRGRAGGRRCGWRMRGRGSACRFMGPCRRKRTICCARRRRAEMLMD